MQGAFYNEVDSRCAGILVYFEHSEC